MIGFLCLLLTVGIYAVAKRMYRNLPKVYLSPLLITPLLVVGILLATERIIPRIAVVASG